MVAVDSSLRKRMFLDKVDTYAKARIAVKSDEQATANAKLSNNYEASAHATSSYKKDQKAFRQNFNPEREFGSRDQNSYRGQSNSRSHSNARGGYQGRNHDGRPDRDPSQYRGRSQSRNQDTRSQSQSRTPACFRCGKLHSPDTCWAKDKQCNNCEKIGHIAPVCRQPKRDQPQHQTSATSNSVEGNLGTVQANHNSTSSDNVWKLFTAAAKEEVRQRDISKADAKLAKILETIARLKEPEVPSTNPQNSESSSTKLQANVIQAVRVYTVRDLEPLESVAIMVKPHQQGSNDFAINILPDSGANVTAIEEQDAEHLTLNTTSIVLKGAEGSVLNTIGTFKATLSRHGNYAEEDIYVVRGLSKPLLSRRMLKELGAVDPKFPHHVWYNSSNHRQREQPSKLQAAVQSSNNQPETNTAP